MKLKTLYVLAVSFKSKTWRQDATPKVRWPSFDFCATYLDVCSPSESHYYHPNRGYLQVNTDVLFSSLDILNVKPQSQLVVCVPRVVRRWILREILRDTQVHLPILERLILTGRIARTLAVEHAQQSLRFPCDIWKRTRKLCFTQVTHKKNVQFEIRK